MKLYLSSMRLGNKAEELRRILGSNSRIGYIPNAGNYSRVNRKKKEEMERADLTDLKKLDLEPMVLDLREYFGRTSALEKELNELGGIYVRGGNTFILRQAMYLSERPYGTETIWEGLGYLDYMILPHYRSEHPESTDIEKEIEFCEKENIPYKTLSDGEFLILDSGLYE